MTKEIITRRHLPHWYVPGAVHFVTFRLVGTLPGVVLADMKQLQEQLLKKEPIPGVSKSDNQTRIHKQLFAIYDQYLDDNSDIDWLKDPQIAAKVRSSLYYLHERKYHLLAYSIMPNHVHVLILPLDSASGVSGEHVELEPGESADEKNPLSAIMHSIKSYTAHEANRLLHRAGPFWQHESYDHWVRDDDELERIVRYINANAVRANLVNVPHDWFWSSAHDRYLIDGDRSGWLTWEHVEPLASRSSSQAQGRGLNA